MAIFRTVQLQRRAALQEPSLSTDNDWPCERALVGSCYSKLVTRWTRHLMQLVKAPVMFMNEFSALFVKFPTAVFKAVRFGESLRAQKCKQFWKQQRETNSDETACLLRWLRV